MIGGQKIKIIGLWDRKKKDGGIRYNLAFSTKMSDDFAAPCEEADTCSIPKEIYDYLLTKKVGDVVTGIVVRSNFRLSVVSIDA